MEKGIKLNALFFKDAPMEFVSWQYSGSHFSSNFKNDSIYSCRLDDLKILMISCNRLFKNSYPSGQQASHQTGENVLLLDCQACHYHFWTWIRWHLDHWLRGQVWKAILQSTTHCPFNTFVQCNVAYFEKIQFLKKSRILSELIYKIMILLDFFKIFD